jgi:hypothetical protein
MFFIDWNCSVCRSHLLFRCDDLGRAREVGKKIEVGKIKNENIKEVMGVKGKPDIIDIIEKKRLQWYATSRGCQRREYRN